MENTKQPSAKKRMNLTIPADLIQSAKDFGLNISKVAESGIRAEVKKCQEIAWLEKNKAGLDAYNAMIEQDGLPLTGYWLAELQEQGKL